MGLMVPQVSVEIIQGCNAVSVRAKRHLESNEKKTGKLLTRVIFTCKSKTYNLISHIENIPKIFYLCLYFWSLAGNYFFFGKSFGCFHLKLQTGYELLWRKFRLLYSQAPPLSRYECMLHSFTTTTTTTTSNHHCHCSYY